MGARGRARHVANGRRLRARGGTVTSWAGHGCWRCPRSRSRSSARRPQRPPVRGRTRASTRGSARRGCRSSWPVAPDRATLTVESGGAARGRAPPVRGRRVCRDVPAPLRRDRRERRLLLGGNGGRGPRRRRRHGASQAALRRASRRRRQDQRHVERGVSGHQRAGRRRSRAAAAAARSPSTCAGGPPQRGSTMPATASPRSTARRWRSVVAAGRPWVLGGPGWGLTESDPLTGEPGARTSVGYAAPIAADADRIWLVTRSYADAATAFELTRFDARSRRVRRMRSCRQVAGRPCSGAPCRASLRAPAACGCWPAITSCASILAAAACARSG